MELDALAKSNCVGLQIVRRGIRLGKKANHVSTDCFFKQCFHDSALTTKSIAGVVVRKTPSTKC